MNTTKELIKELKHKLEKIPDTPTFRKKRNLLKKQILLRLNGNQKKLEVEE